MSLFSFSFSLPNFSLPNLRSASATASHRTARHADAGHHHYRPSFPHPETPSRCPEAPMPATKPPCPPSKTQIGRHEDPKPRILQPRRKRWQRRVRAQWHGRQWRWLAGGWGEKLGKAEEEEDSDR
ncbi:hypothetical protein GUJ93_ZPchr0002g26182 [Zizania palustris]|uniref:Uncharacterized protein n=1 Tax=Zizania palustris TaxID=103762 RepID=A0A8J5SGU6_ZIZPA|nr:hypothetical protein GUJ93_ZPchr0002g26182 [Zizania palustris]